MKILILEPYLGGSHARWLDGVCKMLPEPPTILSLPPRKWKMRMQLAAPYFVNVIKGLPQGRRWFDVVLCSSLLDVSTFRARLHEIEGWNQQAKILAYFHENQFVYPQQIKDPNLYQFTAINFHTASAADRIAFNSCFNRKTFLQGCRKFLKSAADMDLLPLLEDIENRSTVLYPPLEFPDIQADRYRKSADEIRREGGPIIVWNHRWEHDKNPEEFFSVLIRLKRERVPFRVLVLGQNFRFVPSCFAIAKDQLSDRIVHWGYVESTGRYHELLAAADIVVSTAHHEFFGIAVMEAVHLGCRPLLPDRLAYPELFDRSYLYPENSLYEKLKTCLENHIPLTLEEASRLTRPYGTSALAEKYRSWIAG